MRPPTPFSRPTVTSSSPVEKSAHGGSNGSPAFSRRHGDVRDDEPGLLRLGLQSAGEQVRSEAKLLGPCVAPPAWKLYSRGIAPKIRAFQLWNSSARTVSLLGIGLARYSRTAAGTASQASHFLRISIAPFEGRRVGECMQPEVAVHQVVVAVWVDHHDVDGLGGLDVARDPAALQEVEAVPDEVQARPSARRARSA